MKFASLWMGEDSNPKLRLFTGDAEIKLQINYQGSKRTNSGVVCVTTITVFCTSCWGNVERSKPDFCKNCPRVTLYDDEGLAKWTQEYIKAKTSFDLLSGVLIADELFHFIQNKRHIYYAQVLRERKRDSRAAKKSSNSYY